MNQHRYLRMVCFAVILGLGLLPVINRQFRASALSGAAATKRLAPKGAVHQINVRADGQDRSRVRLRTHLDVPAESIGDAEALRALAQNQARPLALASDDFDEDGVADLISSYATGSGGVLSLRRGQMPEPAASRTGERRLSPAPGIHRSRESAPDGERQPETADDAPHSPFRSTAHLFITPEAPELIGVGDFDADGHADLVMAARGSYALYLLAGDGQGNLGAAERIGLPGAVTALATGEINRADGLPDVVVGVAGSGWAQALIYESPEGALRGEPETFALPAAATALVLGQVDEDYPMDLAVAAGRELWLMHGRDRKLSLAEASRAEVASARVESLSFSFDIGSIALGDFIAKADNQAEIALLAKDGTLHLLSKTAAERAPQPDAGPDEWQDESLPSGYFSEATSLVSARLSGAPGEDLIVTGRAGQQLRIVSDLSSTPQSNKATAPAPLTEVSTLAIEGEPVAILPLRLNEDALSDLVMLKENQSAPTVSLTAAAMTFTVTNTNDSGSGSLRQAIMDANSNPGADTIKFSIPGSGVRTITPLTPLPQITSPVTINGLSQPGSSCGAPKIELNGSSAGSGAEGLRISAGSSTVRGLIINRFGDFGIEITTNGGNTIACNFLGTNAAGTSGLPGQSTGISVSSSNNTIGGSGSGTRNVISGNDFYGIFIGGSSATGNRVQSNYIGTNKTGTVAIGNPLYGVLISGNNNTVGNNINNTRNLISGNPTGIEIQGNGNLFQGNYVGTNAAGTAALPNSGTGVRLTGGANNTVGGTSSTLRNVVSGNSNGVYLIGSTATGNLVQGNYIGTNAAGTAGIGNQNGVQFLFGASGNTIGGAVTGAGNRIAFNNDIGVDVSDSSNIQNSMRRNSIYSNGSLGIELGGNGVTANDPGDGDSGPNNYQNYPVISSAVSSGSTMTISGSLNSLPSATFTLEFFANPACDSSGFGEGQTYLGSASVTTDAAGDGSFSPVFTASVPAGQAITATATDAAGNTSEFSQCKAVASAADLSVTKSDSPDPVQNGSNLTYTIVVKNNGPSTATGVMLTDTLPPGVTFVSSSCGGPSCSLGSLASGASTTVTLVVTSVSLGLITNTVTVSGSQPDPNSANNSAVANTFSCGQQVFTAGINDNFTAPTETASPGAELLAFLGSRPLRAFDDMGASRYFGHTFTGLPTASITAATLQIHMRAVKNSPSNDTISLQLLTGSTFAWSSNIGFTGGPPGLFPFYWLEGQDQTITLDLTALPNPFTDLRSDIMSSGRLDVYIEEDTAVDYLVLTITVACPPGPTP